MSFDQDHQLPWTRANEPKWSGASTAEGRTADGGAYRVARQFASRVYQQCQEEVDDLLVSALRYRAG